MDPELRRRLLLISAAAVSLNLGNVAWDVLGPLWTMAELGLAPDDWARLRSLRFTGTLAGTVLIGLAATRWGPRTVGLASLLLAGAALGAIATYGRPALTLALPVFGAAVSSVFIALNSLAQRVAPQHQARANGLYRSVAAGVGVIAPILATLLAGAVGYVAALGVAAAVLVLGCAAVVAHPLTPAPGGGLLTILRALLAPLRRRPLVAFIIIEQVQVLCLSGLVAFVTLRLARDLGMADAAVGTVLTCAAAVLFAGTLLAHPVQRRLGLRRTIATAWLMATVGSVLLGLATTPLSAGAAACLAGLGAGLGIAPTSFAVARLGGPGTEAQTFTAWKLAQALSAVLGMSACAALEPHLGMAGVLVWGGGLAALPLAALMWGAVRELDQC